MHIFTDYIQPLTFWLYAHPHWALFITFLISFCESLAIIGSIGPGSVTMTAIGILAGSGIMRIDLTYIAAMLGAIAGDGGSYALGYMFSDRIISIWPFRNYPDWIDYGKDYFSKHGATSILIGRFFGPMRSIIPVIAGMMHMNHWHFFLANFASGVAWAILYVTPGVIIGAGSSELSTESSTRLFILTLVLLIVIWLTSLGLKWLFIRTNQLLSIKLHKFWVWLNNGTHLSSLTKQITPKNETNHYPTAALSILLIFSFFISLILITLTIQSSWIHPLNNQIHFFFQSLRTHSFDVFFIVIKLIFSPIPLLTFTSTVFIFMILYRDWRAVRFWIILNLITGITIFLLSKLVDLPSPHSITTYGPAQNFPDKALTYAIALFVFYIFYIGTQCRTLMMHSLRLLLFTVLIIGGVALIYLGTNWFLCILSSYFIGLTVCLLCWIPFRLKVQKHQLSQLPIILICCITVASIGVSSSLSLKKLLHLHNLQLAQYVIADNSWWNQQLPLLPIYSTNRIGKPAGLLNIQYTGSINKLQKILETAGWNPRPNSFFYSLVLRASGHHSAGDLPFVVQLYQNRKPTLIMTNHLTNTQDSIILRLWRSNYHLRHYPQPIWLGSVDYLSLPKGKSSTQYKNPSNNYMDAQDYIRTALKNFKFNQMIIPHSYLDSIPNVRSPILLLIKDPAESQATSF